jgi:hypothetical protein
MLLRTLVGDFALFLVASCTFYMHFVVLLCTFVHLCGLAGDLKRLRVASSTCGWPHGILHAHFMCFRTHKLGRIFASFRFLSVFIRSKQIFGEKIKANILFITKFIYLITNFQVFITKSLIKKIIHPSPNSIKKSPTILFLLSPISMSF